MADMPVIYYVTGSERREWIGVLHNRVMMATQTWNRLMGLTLDEAVLEIAKKGHTLQVP